MQKLRGAERAQEAAYDAKKTVLDAQVEAKTKVLAALEAKTKELEEQLQCSTRNAYAECTERMRNQRPSTGTDTAGEGARLLLPTQATINAYAECAERMRNRRPSTDTDTAGEGARLLMVDVGVNTETVGTADAAVPAVEMPRGPQRNLADIFPGGTHRHAPGKKRHRTKTGRSTSWRARRAEQQACAQGGAAAAAAPTAGKRARRAAQPAATYFASATYFAEVEAAAAAAGEQAKSAALQAELEEERR